MSKIHMICLAKSKKGGGYCVAGRRWDERTQSYGEWIRPLGVQHEGALSRSEVKLLNSDFEVIPLQFIEINVTSKSREVPYQTENWVNDPNTPWRETSHKKLPYSGLKQLLSLQEDLWDDPRATAMNRDFVTLDFANRQEDSLRLIRAVRVRISTVAKGDLGKSDTLATFHRGSRVYTLKVTDGRFLRNHAPSIGTSCMYEEAYMTISLTAPFKPSGAHEYRCYKLVAFIATSSESPESTE